MTIGIMTYLTDLAAVGALPTSGAGVIDQIVASQRTAIDHGADDVEQAMREIATGQLPDEEVDGAPYGYALEQFCGYYGTMLVNSRFYPLGFEALAEFDAALREVGVTELLPGSFVGWDPPIPVPQPYDFPSVTTFDAAACRLGAPDYAKAIPALAESPWRATAMQALDWLRRSRDTGQGLVMFCY